MSSEYDCMKMRKAQEIWLWKQDKENLIGRSVFLKILKKHTRIDMDNYMDGIFYCFLDNYKNFHTFFKVIENDSFDHYLFKHIWENESLFKEFRLDVKELSQRYILKIYYSESEWTIYIKDIIRVDNAL